MSTGSGSNQFLQAIDGFGSTTYICEIMYLNQENYFTRGNLLFTPRALYVLYGTGFSPLSIGVYSLLEKWFQNSGDNIPIQATAVFT